MDHSKYDLFINVCLEIFTRSIYVIVKDTKRVTPIIVDNDFDKMWQVTGLWNFNLLHIVIEGCHFTYESSLYNVTYRYIKFYTWRVSHFKWV